MNCNLRHPMGLRHPIIKSMFDSKISYTHKCAHWQHNYIFTSSCSCFLWHVLSSLYIYIYTRYIYIYTHHIYIYTHTQIHTHIYVHTCKYIHNTRQCTHLCAQKFRKIRPDLYIHTCTHNTYIHTHTQIHTLIHNNIHTSTCGCSVWYTLFFLYRYVHTQYTHTHYIYIYTYIYITTHKSIDFPGLYIYAYTHNIYPHAHNIYLYIHTPIHTFTQNTMHTPSCSSSV